MSVKHRGYCTRGLYDKIRAEALEKAPAVAVAAKKAEQEDNHAEDEREEEEEEEQWDREEQEEEEKEKEPPKSPPKKCQFSESCKVTYSTKEEGRAHVTSMHMEQKCQFCDVTYHTKDEGRAHVMSAHMDKEEEQGSAPRKAWQCNLCSHSSISKHGMSTHMSVRHRGDPRRGSYTHTPAPAPAAVAAPAATDGQHKEEVEEREAGGVDGPRPPVGGGDWADGVKCGICGHPCKTRKTMSGHYHNKHRGMFRAHPPIPLGDTDVPEGWDTDALDGNAGSSYAYDNEDEECGSSKGELQP